MRKAKQPESYQVSPETVATLVDESINRGTATSGAAERHRAYEEQLKQNGQVRAKTVRGMSERALRAVGHKLAPGKIDSMAQVEDRARLEAHKQRIGAEWEAVSQDPVYKAWSNDQNNTSEMRRHLDTGYTAENGMKVLPYRKSAYVANLDQANAANRNAVAVANGQLNDYQARLSPEKLREIQAQSAADARRLQDEAMKHLIPTERSAAHVDFGIGQPHVNTLRSRDDAWAGMESVAKEMNDQWDRDHGAATTPSEDNK